MTTTRRYLQLSYGRGDFHASSGRLNDTPENRQRLATIAARVRELGGYAELVELEHPYQEPTHTKACLSTECSPACLLRGRSGV